MNWALLVVVAGSHSLGGTDDDFPPCFCYHDALTRESRYVALGSSLSPSCTDVSTRAINAQWLPSKKGQRSAIPHEECRRGAHLPFLGREPVGG